MSDKIEPGKIMKHKSKEKNVEIISFSHTNRFGDVYRVKLASETNDENNFEANVNSLIAP